MKYSWAAALASASFVAAQGPAPAAPSGVPSYVLQYAPVVYLYTEEQYFPGDIGAQITHTQPEDNFQAVTPAQSPLTLDNLNQLNNQGGANVYLTSPQEVTCCPTNQDWLFGVEPNSSGESVGAISSAIIYNDYGYGTVDAFYMFFYSYNYGGEVPILDHFNSDDHVGDWEHVAIRFVNGEPTQTWYSEHDFGSAYTWAAIPKTSDGRMITYSANGSHANYPQAGTINRSLPGINLTSPVQDFTDQGALWDPTLSAYYFSYSNATNQFTPYGTISSDSSLASTTPVNWLYFQGGWGDQQYPDSDPNQKDFLDLHLLYKYTSGPTGPLDKQLARSQICPTSSTHPCIVFTSTKELFRREDYEAVDDMPIELAMFLE